MLTDQPICARRGDEWWWTGQPTPCRELATIDDHVHAIALGGDLHDPANRQGLCAGCHDEKSGAEAKLGRTAPATVRSAVRTTLVCGPPCSGKTSYVAERARANDLVVDLDALVHALGLPDPHQQDHHRLALLPFAREARDAVLARLAEPSDLRQAWVITSAPRVRDRARFVDATVVILDVPAAECSRRATASRRPHGTDQAIMDWWAAYEPVLA